MRTDNIITDEFFIEAGDTEWAKEATVGDDGMVRNVALCGKVSKNGYQFSETAWGDAARAKSLYEGRPVFIDHPQDRNRALSRSSRDLAGSVRNVVMREGRPYGDVEVLPTDSGRLFSQLAKSRPPNVGMSHVATYRFDNNRKVVESIDSVVSVDVVVFPATTRSFSEQDRGSSMSGQDDKLTTHLETENKRLQSELEKSGTTLRDRDASLDKVTKERDGLQVRVTALESENKTLKADAERHQAEKAIASRKAAIESKLKEHGLNLADTVIVSPAFMESLVNEPDDAKREALIKDRKQILDVAAKGGAKGGGKTTVATERTESQKGTFDPEAEFSQWVK